MYPHERRKALLTYISQRGFASYRDLANALGVSEVTIRRDMRSLRDEGLVETVLGGGQVKGSASEPSFLSKRVLQQREKERIARQARQLIESGMVVGICAGTTTWTLAQSLQGFSSLTFVTNSTNVAEELKSSGHEEIYLTGGHYRTPSDALVGPIAEAAVSQFHTDILFLGVHGIDLESGASTPNLLEASVNRKMMQRTDRVVLLFDHTKWGIEAMAHMADVDEVDDLITDEETPETKEIGTIGIQVHLALL